MHLRRGDRTRGQTSNPSPARAWKSEVIQSGGVEDDGKAPTLRRVRVGRQSVVRMRRDPMVPLARLFDRIDMDDDQRHLRERVQQPMAQLGGHRMRLRHRQVRIDRDVDLGVEAVTQPARADVGYLQNVRHVAGGMTDFLDNGGIDAVEHPREDFLGVLDHDDKNRERDRKTDDRRRAKNRKLLSP